MNNRPPSATHNAVNLAGVLAFFAALWGVMHYEVSGVYATLIATMAYGFTILLLDFFVLKVGARASTGIDFARYDFNLQRILVKLFGVYGSFGFVALLYWLFPEYHGSFYNPYWDAIKTIGAAVLVLTIPYTVFVDCRMREPEDSYYHFGRMILLHGAPPSWSAMVQHLLGWVIKGYFLPLMWIAFGGNIATITKPEFYNVSSFMEFFNKATTFLFTLDLIAAVAGYSLAFRLFDTHFRSAEPTLKGWLVCIICYQPFMSLIMSYYLAYTSARAMNLLNDMPALQILWGCVALTLLIGYSYASLNFGCRFSNLSNRGILTNGMYGLTKHPAYVCKNIYWWMIHAPFIPVNGGAEAFRYCVLLLGVNLVYYLRAKTEEAHLSRDPAYVEYALYMNDHSLFKRMSDYLPMLRYRAPQATS